MQPNTTEQKQSNVVPCTLYNGHYHFGVGALANSLYRSGFRGTMYVGYQPPLPPWTRVRRQDDADVIFEVEQNFTIRFIRWPSERHLTFEKPNFLLHVLNNLARDVDAALFFDADIVIKGHWQFFEEWVRHGVALCLDVGYPLVPANHPWRHAWRELASAQGYPCRDLEYYANGGFIGLPREHRDFAIRWAALTDLSLVERPWMLDRLKFGTREDPFNSADQDTLNAAMMATTVPLSIIGQEAMDFVPAGFLMSHAFDPPKPWHRNFIGSALGGRPPSTAEKMYWRYVDWPIPLFSRVRVISSRTALKIASAIGRFYSRN